MSKLAPAPSLLLLLIWPRSFKWRRERRKQVALVGGKSNSGGFLLLCVCVEMITPYDGEDHNSAVVFNVEVDLGVDLVDDRVDRVGRVGQH